MSSQDATAPHLKRSVGLLAATGSGVALIVGAGVYVLMGEAAAEAGNSIWLSFILAGAAALFTGLSYAELAAMFPRAAASYAYSREAFGPLPAFVVGWLSLFSQVIAVSAVALGFGGYLSEHTGFPQVASALLLTFGAAALALRGARESTLVGTLLALVEVVGLVLIISAGASYFGGVDYLDRPKGLSGVFTGASLLFFAYLGFEQVANLAEEVHRPGRNLPLAILLSGGIAAVLYIVASIAAVSVLGWQALSGTDAPLAAVAREVLGAAGDDILTVIALVATSSTVLIAVVAAARTLFGMASAGSLPGLFARVTKGSHVPAIATASVTAVAVVGVLSGDIGFVAQVTNFTILLVFLSVNLSVMVLRRKLPAQERPFRIPFSVQGWPLVPGLGVATSAVLLANVGLKPSLYGLLIAAAAFPLYWWRKQRARSSL